jgi:hypothetical protein
LLLLSAQSNVFFELTCFHVWRQHCRDQIRTQALLGELDLPAAVASLQAALPHLPGAAGAAHVLPAGLHTPHLDSGALQQLLTLADAAAQRIADLADGAVAAAGDAGEAAAKRDNGWLQPLVTGLETVLTFIEVRRC